jgi:transcriptional regulator with XRE-family HTH domain/quercetin dioxygenase-like cupin family protein
MLGIGEKLRSARQEQNLSLRELAAKAEISASMLSQIENGKANPSVRSLHSIADALDVPFDYFFPNREETLSYSSSTSTGGSSEITASDMRQLSVTSQSEGEGKVDIDASAPRNCQVLRASDRPVIDLKGNVRWARLTAEAEKDAEFLEIFYQPGASSGANMSHHVGREFGLVTEGELLLELGFDTYTLFVGDSVIFDSNTPHRLSNPGDGPMRAIWVVINKDHYK